MKRKKKKKVNLIFVFLFLFLDNFNKSPKKKILNAYVNAQRGYNRTYCKWDSVMINLK